MEQDIRGRQTPAAHRPNPLELEAPIFTGTVRLKASRVALSNIRLKWLANFRPSILTKSHTVVLGNGVSDGNGRFRLTLDNTAEARDAFRLLSVLSDADSHLLIDEPSLTSDPLAVRETSQDNLEILLIRSPKSGKNSSKSDWTELGNFLAVNRILSAGELSDQLARPWQDSPINTWAAATRIKASADLAAALDKIKGNLVFKREVFFDFKHLEAGDLMGAIRDGLHIPSPGGLGHLTKSNTRLYRDYLRGIWVSAARTMHPSTLTGSGDVPQATLEKQLNNRLHQDFRVSSETNAPAAVLLAAIVKSALSTPKPFGGFGKLPGQIPAKASTETDADYLAKLIAVTGVSADELERRLRVSFQPGLGEMATPIELNIDALRGFLSDSFQAPQDPFPARPDVSGRKPKPIIFHPFTGKAPFYLQYEEWLERRKAFHCENVFDIRRTIPIFSDQFRKDFAALWQGWNIDAKKDETYFSSAYTPPVAGTGVGAWVVSVFDLCDAANVALQKIDAESYKSAATALGELELKADELLHSALDAGWYRDEFSFQSDTGSPSNRAITLKARATSSTADLDGLKLLEAFFKPSNFPPLDVAGGGYSFASARERALSESGCLYLHWVFYLRQVCIPVLRSRIAAALGDYATTSRLLGYLTGVVVGTAEPDTTDVYSNNPLYENEPFRRLFRLSSLPYTAAIEYDATKNVPNDVYPLPLTTHMSENFLKWQFEKLYGSFALSACEWRSFRLSQGDAMLAWAEQLFRNDDPSSIRRARELYKGVLILHGVDPDTFPRYPNEDDDGFTLLLINWFSNPAIAAQVARARYSLYLITAGLNAYGWREDMVPILRYRPLKDASDAFAASAKSAQNDFLAYTGRFEESQIARMQAAQLLQKAQISVKIAEEQVAIVSFDVERAKAQVTEVEKAITAKQQEIADKDSLFSQFTDYLAGAKDAIKGLVPLTQANAKDTSPAQSLGFSDITSAVAVGSEKGFLKGASALGTGAGVLGGMAVFYYASYTSMTGMESAANKRAGEIHQLRDVALPAAKAQVALKQRSLAIANYEKQIAAVDLQYATELFNFELDRLLSAEMWARLASLANRFMRRYVDLGARTAWQAERALAYEQNRVIHIIRKNYLPMEVRGVTGADILQMDLAELENTRLMGLRLTTPIKHTISLVQEFPLAFGALKSKGMCSFISDEALIRASYPGVYGCRIRAVTTKCVTSDSSTLRGTLRNRGISLVSESGGNPDRALTKFPDALALSEFRLKDDMQVYGLPGETLLQFEGSGLTTQWDLILGADVSARSKLVDILITLDAFALYEDGPLVPSVPLPSTSKAVLFAATTIAPRAFNAIQTEESQEVLLDLRKLELPSGCLISNIGLMTLGSATSSGSLKAVDTGQSAAFTFTDDVAASNSAPFDNSQTAMPLNAICDVPANQTLRLQFPAGDLSGLRDVLVYLEYRPAS